MLVPTANFHPYSFANDPIIRVRAFESHVHVIYANWSEHVNEDGVHFNGQSVCASPQGEPLMMLSSTDCGLFHVPGGVDVRGVGALDGHEDDYLRDLRPELYASQGRWASRTLRAVAARVGMGVGVALVMATVVMVARRKP